MFANLITLPHFSVFRDELAETGLGPVTLLLKRASASRPSGDVVTFFSTLLDNRRSMLVIEPLSQSDRANSNSCFSDLQPPNPG